MLLFISKTNYFLLYFCFSIWFLSSRLSAGHRVSEETLQALSTTSALRPHPPPRLCQPRPPFSAPPGKTAASVKLIHSSSLSQTHGQQKSMSDSSGPRKTQTPICNRITPSGHANSHFATSLPGPGSDQIMAKATHHRSRSSERDSADLHCRTPSSSPSFQIKPPGVSTIHRSIYSPGRKSDLSPQRKSSPAWRSRNINTTATSPHCVAGSYSSNSTDHFMSTKEKSTTQSGTCAGGLVSTTVLPDNDTRKSTSERFHSCVGSRNNNSGTDRNKNGHLGKDVTQQPSLVASVWQTAPHIIQKAVLPHRGCVWSSQDKLSVINRQWKWLGCSDYLFEKCYGVEAHLVERVPCIKAETFQQRSGFDSSTLLHALPPLSVSLQLSLSQ